MNLVRACNAVEGPHYNESQRQKILLQTALRWCRSEPILEPGNHIDTFIDKYLHHLPVPRYARTCHASPSDEEISECIVIELQRQNILTDDDVVDDVVNLTTASNCFMALVPLIQVLRDSTTSTETAICILALIAMDPINSIRIRASDTRHPDFVKTAHYILEQEGLVIKDNLLEDLDEFLTVRHVIAELSKLPEATCEWTKLSDVIENELLDFNKIKEILEDFSSSSGLPVDMLQSMAYIKNLVDEDIQIGFMRGQSV